MEMPFCLLGNRQDITTYTILLEFTCFVTTDIESLETDDHWEIIQERGAKGNSPVIQRHNPNYKYTKSSFG